jgi:uncharacterized protein (DUF58 family)
MLHASKIICQPWRVLVQPEIHRLRPNVLQAIISEGPMGQRSIRRGRGGEEFYGIREFQAGDTLGDVAWKASSRKDTLVSIERSRPSPPRLRVVLDLTTPTNYLQCRDARTMEEQSISLAASLLAEALRQGHEFALTVLGLTTSPDVGLRCGQRHLDRLLGTLASLNLDDERQKIQQQMLRNFERVGRVVIRPDRSEKVGLTGNDWFFTGSQLHALKHSKESSTT